MDAVYFYESTNGLSLLRFYEDGTVIKAFVETQSVESIPKILKWFNPQHNPVSKGQYKKRGQFINFEVSRSENEVVVCIGTFMDNEEKLNLYSHSHINDFKTEQIYTLFQE